MVDDDERSGDGGPTDDDVTDTQPVSTPEGALSEELRTALGSMREEADRIAGLETGTEQVEAAEQFAEDAGRLDESVGSAARAADDDRG